MAVHILTIPFDPEHQCFPDDDLRHFLANKRVRSMRPAFFQQDGHPYWTILIEYEPLLSEEEQRPHEPDLPEDRQHLLARLREWRKEQAERDGVPVFLIATRERGPLLKRVNQELERQRVLFRIAHDRRYLSVAQYEHIAKALDEAGRMTGGWLKDTHEKARPSV